MKPTMFFLAFLFPIYLNAQVNDNLEKPKKNVRGEIGLHTLMCKHFLPETRVDGYLEALDFKYFTAGPYFSIIPSSESGIEWGQLSAIFSSTPIVTSDSALMTFSLGYGIQTYETIPEEETAFAQRALFAFEIENEDCFTGSFKVGRVLKQEGKVFYKISALFAFKRLNSGTFFTGMHLRNNQYWGANLEYRFKKIPLFFVIGGGWNVEDNHPGYLFGLGWER